jgi:hypothetical protein
VAKGKQTAAHWAVLASLVFPGMAISADSLNLEEGYWDTYVTIRVQGGILPVPAIKSSKCITRQDPLPNSTHSSRMKCNVFDKAVVGNDVSWRIECADDKGKMEGAGKITYAGRTFDGGMDMLVTEIGGDRRLKLNYAMHGERVRSCDAAPLR